MEEVAKTPAQLKKEAKRLEKLAKFNAKKEKLASQKAEQPKAKQAKAVKKVVEIEMPTANKDGKKSMPHIR